VIDALAGFLADPPRVHPGCRHGVWASDTSLYRFLVDECDETMHTLETGLGISTALFAWMRTEHTCVVVSQAEVDACCAYLNRRGIDHDRVQFVVGPSQVVLPTLEPGELDLFLIDGCHGFPTPTIDWFYGARWLGRGGLLVVDDTDLPSVQRSLSWYLDLDPRWEAVATLPMWRAYRRCGEGYLGEEWTEQGFLQ